MKNKKVIWMGITVIMIVGITMVGAMYSSTAPTGMDYKEQCEAYCQEVVGYDLDAVLFDTIDDYSPQRALCVCRNGHEQEIQFIG